MANFKRTVKDLDVPDLTVLADEIRSLERHAGWLAVLAALDSHRELLLGQLLNPTAKAEDVDRLRGEILGLQGAREAAEQIVAYAAEAEAEAKRVIAREMANA